MTGYGPWGGKESDTAEVTQHMQVPRSEGQHCQGSLQPILAQAECEQWLGFSQEASDKLGDQHS